ncbi:hypothetical protein G9F72_009025 [Clostridium estertheticum]|uniref:hypothetical protein n=1 Tax=Clostridium estertheticum TaxID=238834 RepID=UPI001CD0EEAA|nr:hypothetical protein [Clostridium estertheticum]MBZ9686470.1 hypothetical protein [Clostridium estertheticum]
MFVTSFEFSTIFIQNVIKRLEEFIECFENLSNKQNYLEEIFDEDLIFLNRF